jgi:hypothetical protein
LADSGGIVTSDSGFPFGLTVFFFVKPMRLYPLEISKIGRSIAIVVEAAQNSNCADFSEKSKAKKFGGPPVGFRPPKRIFCACDSMCYND